MTIITPSPVLTSARLKSPTTSLPRKLVKWSKLVVGDFNLAEVNTGDGVIIVIFDFSAQGFYSSNCRHTFGGLRFCGGAFRSRGNRLALGRGGRCGGSGDFRGGRWRVAAACCQRYQP